MILIMGANLTSKIPLREKFILPSNCFFMQVQKYLKYKISLFYYQKFLK